MIFCKRIYLPAEPRDGPRILVERLWPRGVSKASADIDLWLKNVAPSPELRRWYGHDTSRREVFRLRYLAELKANPEPVAHLLNLAASGNLTLVYAARDEPGNSAQILHAYLQGQQPGKA